MPPQFLHILIFSLHFLRTFLHKEWDKFNCLTCNTLLTLSICFLITDEPQECWGAERDLNIAYLKETVPPLPDAQSPMNPPIDIHDVQSPVNPPINLRDVQPPVNPPINLRDAQSPVNPPSTYVMLSHQ